VALLNGGRIEQVGSAQAILDAPATAFVAGFVGQANALKGRVEGRLFRFGEASLPAPAIADGAAIAFVRPDQLALAAAGDTGFEVTLHRVTPRGPLIWLDAAAPDGQLIEAALLRESAPAFTPGGVHRLAMRGGQVFADD
jgi:sulfate transport system ATP-binding protein